MSFQAPSGYLTEPINKKLKYKRSQTSYKPPVITETELAMWDRFAAIDWDKSIKEGRFEHRYFQDESGRSIMYYMDDDGTFGNMAAPDDEMLEDLILWRQEGEENQMYPKRPQNVSNHRVRPTNLGSMFFYDPERIRLRNMPMMSVVTSKFRAWMYKKFVTEKTHFFDYMDRLFELRPQYQGNQNIDWLYALGESTIETEYFNKHERRAQAHEKSLKEMKYWSGDFPPGYEKGLKQEILNERLKKHGYGVSDYTAAKYNFRTRKQVKKILRKKRKKWAAKKEEKKRQKKQKRDNEKAELAEID